VSRRPQIENGSVSSARQAAAAAGVSPPVVRRWLDLGLISAPPWTLQQLQKVRDSTDPQGQRRGSHAAHGTWTRWNQGCSCEQCRCLQSDTARVRGRAKAQTRLSMEVRQQLLKALSAGQPFREVLRDLGLTPNAVWGLAKTDLEWAGALEGTLEATRRSDLEHGTNAAYVAGCVFRQCREHQQKRMGRR
jgi:hypothetical protein